MTEIINEGIIEFLRMVEGVKPYPDFDTAKGWFLKGYMAAAGKYQNMLVKAGVIDSPELKRYLEKLDEETRRKGE